MSNNRARLSPLRTDLAYLIRSETGMTMADAENTVGRILKAITYHIMNHEKTTIHGFGTFLWVSCKERKFKSGLFGERTIPAYKKLKFRSTVEKKGN